MKNPWEDISLADYEGHMSLGCVGQLQAVNAMMKEQFEACPAGTAMVLGVAGGNGLEHVRRGKYRALYAVDINEDYLKAVSERYADLAGVVKCLRLDLTREPQKLPHADLVIADLLIEYIGCAAFREAVRHAGPRYVSCAVQVDAGGDAWVSNSPYLHAFDALEGIHRRIDEGELEEAMEEIGFAGVLREETALPNGKKLLRLDFKKKAL